MVTNGCCNEQNSYEKEDGIDLFELFVTLCTIKFGLHLSPGFLFLVHSTF